VSEHAIAIRQEIDLARPMFERVSTSAAFEVEAGFAMQALMASDYIMKVALMNRQSVINAVTNIAAIGISLNPAKKQAYLVPRDGKICLDISYMGLLDLAIDSGSIRWGQAELVYEKDTFELNGVDQPPTHKRDPFAQDRGKFVGVYVVVKTMEGDYLTTTMVIEEVYSIRDRSSAWKAYVEKKKSCPWVTDEGEMIKKTVIKRAYKTWPKTEKLAKAIHHLNTENEEGLEPIENAAPLDQPTNFGVTPARAKVIRAAAGAAIQKFNENDEFGAYEEVSGITDSEEMQALWSILRPHSALRSAIKRLAAEQRKRDEEMATMEVPKTAAA
jgi:recombination protein RecT